MLDIILKFLCKIKDGNSRKTFELVKGVLEEGSEGYEVVLERWHKLYKSGIEDEYEEFIQEFLNLSEFAKTALSPITKAIEKHAIAAYDEEQGDEDNALRLALEQKVR